MLDADLAKLYGVETKALNRAVKRNLARFPDDFMFQLSEKEADFLRYQSGTLKTGHGQHRKYRPHAFTEQDVAMLSSVLRSERAVRVNIEIMREFPHCGSPCTLHLVPDFLYLLLTLSKGSAVISPALQPSRPSPPPFRAARAG